MRKIVFLFPILCFFLFSCNSTENKSRQDDQEPIASRDTIIIGKDVPLTWFGTDLYEKGTDYSVLIGQDTAGFTCRFGRYKKDGRVSISLWRLENEDWSYQDSFDLFERIMKVASEDGYKLDSVQSVYLGRLASLGRLILDVSDEYEQKFGSLETSRLSYIETMDFLKNSKLVTPFNEAFAPYGLAVSRVGVEKLHSASLKDILFFKEFDLSLREFPKLDSQDSLKWILDGHVDLSLAPL